jgi:hypothetical protein
VSGHVFSVGETCDNSQHLALKIWHLGTGDLRLVTRMWLDIWSTQEGQSCTVPIHHHLCHYYYCKTNLIHRKHPQRDEVLRWYQANPHPSSRVRIVQYQMIPNQQVVQDRHPQGFRPPNKGDSLSSRGLRDDFQSLHFVPNYKSTIIAVPVAMRATTSLSSENI